MSEKVRWLFGAVLILGLVLFGCGGDGSTLGPDGTPDNGDNGGNGDNGDNGTAKVTLSELSDEIFTQSCAGCHGGGNPSKGLSLAKDVIAASIIDKAAASKSDYKLVNPGSPEDSYIVMKLENRDIIGSQMPRGGTPLSTDQIKKIRDWIAAGAPAE